MNGRTSEDQETVAQVSIPIGETRLVFGCLFGLELCRSAEMSGAGLNFHAAQGYFLARFVRELLVRGTGRV
jgi:hypothetical protein